MARKTRGPGCDPISTNLLLQRANGVVVLVRRPGNPKQSFAPCHNNAGLRPFRRPPAPIARTSGASVLRPRSFLGLAPRLCARAYLRPVRCCALVSELRSDPVPYPVPPRAHSRRRRHRRRRRRLPSVP
jgi:hypothetical protein